MEPKINKSQLRKTSLHYRQLLSKEEYENRNHHLFEKTLEFVKNHEVKIIHAFLAIEKNREPDIQPFLRRFWELNVEVLVSRTDFKLNRMEHFYLREDTILEMNGYYIPEPTKGSTVGHIEQAELILVPLLIADKQGQRVGYGGGYYDRLLQETNATKIGLSLSSPVDSIVQCDTWDIPLNHLITPYKTYNYG